MLTNKQTAMWVMSPHVPTTKRYSKGKDKASQMKTQIYFRMLMEFISRLKYEQYYPTKAIKLFKMAAVLASEDS